MRNGFISLLPVLFGFAVHAAAQSPKLALDLGGGVTLDTVLVKPGRFTQGSPETEPGREPDELARPITLSQGFYMGVHVVTRAHFARFVQDTGFRTEAEKGLSGGYGVVNGALVQDKKFTWQDPGFPQPDNHPVVLVTYDDALAFCRWLSQKSRHEVTLPTEAQWEYACRAGTTEARYAEPLDTVARHRDNSGGATSPVGTAPANAWGATDFYGPVWQWCLDWYAPYRPGPGTDPFQTDATLSDKPRRVLRGGSFLSGASHARSAERYRNDPKTRNADNGFRIVCSLAESSAQAAGAPGYAEPGPPRETRILPPPASALPKPLPAQPTSLKNGWGGLIVLGIFAAAILWILRKITGFFTRPSTLAGAAAGTAATSVGPTGREMADRLSTPYSLDDRFKVRLADNGFYITGLEELIGRTLRFITTVKGRPYSGEITFTPGPEGHFIFTGSRPENVTIRVEGPVGGGADSESGDRRQDDNQESGDSDFSDSGEDIDPTWRYPRTDPTHPPAY